MPREIERKFLVKDDRWRDAIDHYSVLRQGYLVSDAVRSVRVRITDRVAHLNIKSATVGISRSEYEYEIPLADAEELLTLCTGPLIEKTRYAVHYGRHLWEIDVFDGDNAGLVVAEVELQDPQESIDYPPWIGLEVSHDVRYYNAYLAVHPYRSWSP